MSKLIEVTNVTIENSRALFNDPFKITVTFQCNGKITEEIEWELIYIRDGDEQHDITLDSFSMSNLEPGMMSFNIESNPPNYQNLTKEEILGVSAIVLKTQYRKQEFIRVGYYVYNQYEDPELLENDPENVIIEKVVRLIMADKPRITRFDINWDKQVVQPINPEALNEMTKDLDKQIRMADPFKTNGIFEKLNQLPSFNQQAMFVEQKEDDKENNIMQSNNQLQAQQIPQYQQQQQQQPQQQMPVQTQQNLNMFGQNYINQANTNMFQNPNTFQPLNNQMFPNNDMQFMQQNVNQAFQPNTLF